jgi:hypothetical protein
MNHIVTLGLVLLLVAIDVGFAVIAIDRLAQGYTDIKVIPATDLPIRF